MENLTTKKLQRLQRKQAKMAAFLEIAKLNDNDKETKLQKESVQTSSSDESTNLCSNNAVADNFNLKRSYDKKDDNANSEVCNKEQEDKTESPAAKKPRLHGEEYIKLKQQLKERTKKLKSLPWLNLRDVGENAVISVESIGKRIPIFLSDVQHLLLYSLLGQVAPYSPRWCKLDKYNKVNHRVVLVVEGLSLYHYVTNESMFPHVTNNLKYRLEIALPAMCEASLVEELAAVPLSGTQSQTLIKRYGCLETALKMNQDIIKLLRTTFPMPSMINNTKHMENNEKNTEKNPSSTDKFDRTKLLLSLEQMVEENFPVPLQGALAERYKSYVLTKDSYKEVTITSPIFAVDCEMCLTTSGENELTRISIVDESLNVVYNTLVKPENVIVNYLTRYSGITEKMLADVKVTLHDVQETLRKLLPADVILVGHSLNCDLHALRMMHPYNIDTSVIFNITGNRCRKSKLQLLAQEFLGEKIQNNKAGHCSIEDSKATMKLVKLKLANSLSYGDAVLLGYHDVESSPLEASEMSFHAMQKMEGKKYAVSIFNHVMKNKDTTAAIVSEKDIMSKYARYLGSSSLKIMDDENFTKGDDQIRFVVADDNKHAVKRTSEIAMEHDFVVCHVKITDEQLQGDTVEETLRKVNKWVGKLWRHSAMNCLFCVVFGGQVNVANGACFVNLKTGI